jgi:hypothetical protein
LAQCEPTPGSPANTRCDITTSCVLASTKGGAGSLEPYFCACRSGYRADVDDGSITKPAEWRLHWPGQENRVFVRPGIVCTRLCQDWPMGAASCEEVPYYGEIFSSIE